MMISEELSSHASKQTLHFPVGLLIRSPKKSLAKLGRKPSNGSLQSNNSEGTTRSAENTGVRQPAKNKIRRHNNRLATVFNRSPILRRDGGQGHGSAGTSATGDMQAADDPSELSCQMSAPGILKIFGSDICQGTNYKSVLATTRSRAKELVKEALERYCLEKEDPNQYVLCDVIGRTGADHQWKTECFRVVSDHEKPLMLQSLWKPKEGFSRRFEIQKRATVEERSTKDTDNITAGINAQARKLQTSRSRVTSLFVDSSGVDVDTTGMWRSQSETDLSATEEAARAQRQAKLTREDPEAEADTEALRLGMEKEETESSDDNTTQYSIHPPFDFPYFLLLQGYSYRQDFVIYLMSGTTTIFGRCREHCIGEDEERLKVDILLFAPDILPRHCCVRRLDSGNSLPGEAKRTLTLLKPLHGAPVMRNGSLLKEEVELSPGDLVGLGHHYLFMFKDPTGVPGAQQTPTWMKLLCLGGVGVSSSCQSCGSSQRKKRSQHRKGNGPPRWKDPEGEEVSVSYELEQEDRILEEILVMVDANGEEAKLSPAFLLSLCVQHSADSFELPNLRRLLLHIASQIQLTMWEKTKELAAVQTETSANDIQQEPKEVHRRIMEELIPGLRPLVLWMANSLELLHFIQHDIPLLLAWRQGEEEKEEISSTRAASEEAMTVLEEVIMFTFQQSVYYLTKSMYTALPGLMDGNPFCESGQLRVPEGVCGILEVLKEALSLLNTFQVHPEISSQLCAYLFFFTNASLFNALMERGSGGGFYQWSKGVQIRANLDLLLDWIQGMGMGDLAMEFFQKLSAAVNLLATPKENLLQASWSSLRSEFMSLNPAQLHHMLREYNPGRACPAAWNPSPDEAYAALRTTDILESFDNHPPLILPSNTFHLELGKPITEPALFKQLARLQDFILSLPTGETAQQTHETTTTDVQSATSPHATAVFPRPLPRPSLRADEDSEGTPASPRSPRSRGSHGDLSCFQAEAQLNHKLKSLELQNSLPGSGQSDLGCHKSLALDPSCLLTPPNTPQGSELTQSELEADLQKEAVGTAAWKAGACPAECSEEGTEKVEEEDEKEEVFTVELHRGPHGLGLALVDGLKTPLKTSGIYIKSVVPDSPAAMCLKLRPGDHILAVNGISVVGMEYHVGRELIRSSGNALRLLVAKIEDTPTGSTSVTKC
ncbi:hypothetical protein DPEC_G00305280 [Dallia pectoralis]|uniref:Uncharacterized protein n=1 Tax=Dallia pectoralis TaxID=75939 RepID=A0ACC2FDQ8_DALPE|nr:hypothetical protein DPEC_G00305280 [Dallia pectoralis]